VKMPIAVRRGGAQYSSPSLCAVCHRHVPDGSARRIKNNTLDSLSRLEFFNDNKLPTAPVRVPRGGQPAMVVPAAINS
jgi:hypothetical protein